MPIQQVSTFMTSDGKKHDSLEAAEVHELTLELTATMDAVAEAHDINSRTMVTIKRYLPLFIHELGYVRVPDAPMLDARYNEDEAEREAA